MHPKLGKPQAAATLGSRTTGIGFAEGFGLGCSLSEASFELLGAAFSGSCSESGLSDMC